MYTETTAGRDGTILWRAITSISAYFGGSLVYGGQSVTARAPVSSSVNIYGGGGSTSCVVEWVCTPAETVGMLATLVSVSYERIKITKIEMHVYLINTNGNWPFLCLKQPVARMFFFLFWVGGIFCPTNHGINYTYSQLKHNIDLNSHSWIKTPNFIYSDCCPSHRTHKVGYCDCDYSASVVHPSDNFLFCVLFYSEATDGKDMKLHMCYDWSLDLQFATEIEIATVKCTIDGRKY